MTQPPAIRLADLANERDTAAIVKMIAIYSENPIAGGVRLSQDVQDRLPQALRDTPGAFVFLAFDSDAADAQPLGVATCFQALSTFSAKPKVNLHDLAVIPEAQGRGIGRALMDAAIAEAKRRGASQFTFEVHPDNAVGKALYASNGFACTYEFWSKQL